MKLKGQKQRREKNTRKNMFHLAREQKLKLRGQQLLREKNMKKNTRKNTFPLAKEEKLREKGT